MAQTSVIDKSKTVLFRTTSHNLQAFQWTESLSLKEKILGQLSRRHASPSYGLCQYDIINCIKLAVTTFCIGNMQPISRLSSRWPRLTFPTCSHHQSWSLCSLGWMQRPVVDDSWVVFVGNEQTAIHVQSHLAHAVNNDTALVGTGQLSLLSSMESQPMIYSSIDPTD